MALFRSSELNSQLFIGLLNPGIGVLLAAAFFLLWLNRRDQVYVAVAASSYVTSTLAFLIQDVGPSLPYDLERLPSNICFLLTGCLLVSAVLMRYRLAIPYRTFAAIVALGAGGMYWFLVEQPSLTARIYTVNFLIGAIAVIGAAKLYRVEKQHLVDRLLFWALVVSAANFLLRPITIMSFSGSFDNFDSFQRSLYWTTVQFTQAMISVMFALNLLIAIAIDLIAELKQEANTDKLSGLLNRRGFEMEAAAVLERRGAEDASACLLIADLDHFKGINDTHGHAVGDEVIRLFGRQIAMAAAGKAVAGRIGGEEFAILIPNTSLGAARTFAESLRAGLALYCAGQLPPGLLPTTSIGVCVAERGTSLHVMMHRADEALYVAKREGRNQVQVHAPPADDPALTRRA